MSMPTRNMKMSVANWIALPDHPRSRDIEERAERAMWGHLAEYNPIHQFVMAAVVGGEIAYKLDGHLRSHLWKHKNLDTPPDGNVIVCLVHFSDEEKAKEAYNMVCKIPDLPPKERRLRS